MITRTNFVKNILFIIASLSGTIALAQEEDSKDEKKFSFSGTIDTYYRTNLNSANSGDNYSTPGTSFANLSGFALGMANIITSYEGEKVGFVGDLVFGPRGTDAIFASPLYSATGNIVNQLYAYWNVNESVKLTIGNFNTFLGYEVISPSSNFNYSTSYLFSYGPFSHTGLKADIDLGNDWSAMVSIMNPTDLTEYNPNGTYAFGAQLGHKGQFLNVLVDHGTYEIDFTGGFNLSETFYLGVNGAYFDNSDEDIQFAGVALYPQLATSESFKIGLRGEYFTETNLGAIGAADANGKASVLAFTLTGSATIGDLIIKPELRLDSASEDAFLDSKGNPMSGLSSFVLAAIYQF